jgi:hypothetical protein
MHARSGQKGRTGPVCWGLGLGENVCLMLSELSFPEKGLADRGAARQRTLRVPKIADGTSTFAL